MCVLLMAFIAYDLYGIHPYSAKYMAFRLRVEIQIGKGRSI